MDRFKMSVVTLCVYSAAFILLFVSWGFVLYNQKSFADQQACKDYLTYIHEALIGLTAHILTILGTDKPKTIDVPSQVTVSNAQSGFVSLSMLLVIGVIGTLCLTLTGCAGQVQALSAYNTSAVVSARASADLATKISAETFCTMSVDTLARNPQYVKAVQALCWSGSTTTPADAANALLPVPDSGKPFVNPQTLPVTVK